MPKVPSIRRNARMSCALIVLAVFTATSALILTPAQAQQGNAPEKVVDKDVRNVEGRLVRLPLPITGNVDRRIKKQIRRAVSELKRDQADRNKRRILILQFDAGKTKFGLGSEFEDCLKLARLLTSSELNGIRTVAYIPQSIKGHAVLVAMACEQIVMSAEAEIGDAGASHDENNPIDATITSGYELIARRRHTVPVEIALGMLDPKYQVLKVQTEDGPRIIFAEELEDLRATKTIDEGQTQVVFARGEPGLLNGRLARDLAVVQVLAADRPALASQLGLSRDAITSDWNIEGEFKAHMIMLDRYIDAKVVETRIKMIDDAVRAPDVNFICLWIDSAGGDLRSATRLAHLLAELNSSNILTVASVMIPN